MSFTKKLQLKRGGEAVSPVVGVMLMLVVTIIIAAVVSAFAGGLTKTTDNPPSIAMDVAIKNTGYASGSFMTFDVRSTSEPIPTKNIKIVTSYVSGSGVAGGNTTGFGINSPNSIINSVFYQSPIGFGSGITAAGSNQVTDPSSGSFDANQNFGNYTLTPGTTMECFPSTSYGTANQYMYSTISTDGMNAVLGKSWNATRPGDVITVDVIHIPSGKVIFSKDVVVSG